ncbi:MAG: amidohydrolase family protein [Planctomycetes bacterium]|nr:amidohydrolase family protein [Planctomycetota bacterium]
MRTLLRDGIVVTMNATDTVFFGSVLIEDGRVVELLRDATTTSADRVVDLEGHALVPGFVQTHVHGCQTLFRGAADDRALLDWLKQRIWPLEAAHDARSLAASCELTALELLRSGTTAALTMETVHHTEAACSAYARTPLKATVGKCLMDQGDEVPAGLTESTANSLREAEQFLREYPPHADARLRACFAPRFALSCSEGLLRDVAALTRAHGALIHTHGAEQKAEVELVRRATGFHNLAYLDHVGMLAPQLRLAHVVHLEPAEWPLLRDSGTHVLHCPSSNLKLGSGIAPIVRYLALGIPVSIGADGAPCNNNLDALREARLAAQLQANREGPGSLPAHQALALITRNGAAALERAHEFGSIREGLAADLVEIDLGTPHVVPSPDPISAIIYAAERADIRRVFVDGEVVVERGEALYTDAQRVVARANEEARKVFSRAGVAR